MASDHPVLARAHTKFGNSLTRYFDKIINISENIIFTIKALLWNKSDQKHECEKGAKFGTNGFADKRVVI